jgi:hypothetical protein
MVGVLNVMTNSAAVQIIVCHVSNVWCAFSLDDFRPMHSASCNTGASYAFLNGVPTSLEACVAYEYRQAVSGTY